MKKFKKILFSIILFILISSTVVFADVGSFEDYGSGGSSYDYGYDYGYDYDYGYSSGGDLGLFLFFLDPHVAPFIIIVIIISIIIAKKNKGKNIPNYYTQTRPQKVDSLQDMNSLNARELQIENKIQVNDPNFNKEEFIANSKNLFIRLQQAWTERDWETIRAFETESLFEQHKNQLQGYINNNQINVMDRICVNYAHLYGYRQEGDKEILTVRLNSRMQDYIIDATTKEVLRGNKFEEKVNTYLLTFIRKNGVKTKEGTAELNTTNCPNCGAPTIITSSGRCEYCGSIITTGEYNWVLSNLQREN